MAYESAVGFPDRRAEVQRALIWTRWFNANRGRGSRAAKLDEFMLPAVSDPPKPMTGVEIGAVARSFMADLRASWAARGTASVAPGTDN